MKKIKSQELSSAQYSINTFVNTIVNKSFKDHFQRHSYFNATDSKFSKFDDETVAKHSIQLFDVTKTGQANFLCYFSVHNEIAELFKKYDLVPSFILRFFRLDLTKNHNFESFDDFTIAETYHPQLTTNKMNWSDEQYDSFEQELRQFFPSVGIKPIFA